MKKNSNYIYILFLIFCACSQSERPLKTVSEKAVAILVPQTPLSKTNIAPPTVNPAKTPQSINITEGNVLPYESNIHPLSQPTIIAMDSAKVHRISIIDPPKTTAASGRTVSCNIPESIPISDLRFKDDATYNIQYLDVAQGLASSYIRELFEDKRGNIWITTDGELLCYNGRSLTNFSKENQILKNSRSRLKEDSNGNLWIGNHNGLIKYDGKTFMIYDTIAGLPNNKVSGLVIDKNNNVWVSTLKGLSKFDGTKFSTYSLDHGFKTALAGNLLFDGSGKLWCGTVDEGVYCFDGKSFININEKNGLLSNRIESMASDKAGNIWIASQSGVNKYNGKTLESFQSKQGLINNNVRNVMTDGKGNVWFSAYRGGMSCFDGKNFTWYTEKEGLSISTVDCFIEDHCGNIWAGTDGGGICKLTPRSFQHFIPNAGFDAIIMGIGEDSEKNIWLGSYDNGLFKYDGNKLISIKDEEKIFGTILLIKGDKKGNVWLNSNQGYLNKYDGKSFVRYRKEEGAFSDRINGITEDKEGNIWASTTGEGIIKFDGKNFTRYKKEQGLISNNVGNIISTSNGKLWLSTDEGLCEMEKGKVVSVLSKQIFENASIRNIVSDVNGNLWIGTLGKGIFRYDGKYLMKIGKSEGLSNDFIRSIVEDKEWNIASGYNGVWVSTDYGIDHIVMKNNSHSFDDLQISVYTRSDGLRGEDFCSNSGLMDSRGRAWWGSVKGLTSLQTNDFRMDTTTPKINLDYIDLEQNFIDFNALKDSIKEKKSWFIGEKEPLDLSSIKFSDVPAFCNYPLNLELPYNINSVTFNYSVIDWINGHKIKYQYFLEGSDKDWHPITSETKAIYTSLHFGTYTFKVKAKGVSEKWSKPFEYTFVINPPWWQTIWAYLVYVLAFIAVTLIYLNSRTKALRKRQKELEQIVEERTADVVDEKNKVQEKNKIIETKQKEILDSILYAENIQRTLLANHDFVNQTIPDSFVFFKPKDIVSGDFYWATKVNELFYLAVCDSTGHGVPGAFMSLLNISFLNEAINEKNIYEPQKVFDHVRQRLIENISQNGRKDGMDGILVCFNMKNNSICYAASNNAPILISNGQLAHLPMDKMPIGVGDKMEPFKQFNIPHKKGDMLYVFTDGYSDQFGGPKGKKFMNKQLQEILLDNYKAPLKEQEKIIRNSFENWKGSLEQVDDVCIIGIKL